MQKITNYIFELSPKKLALWLVLGPLLLAAVHTACTLIFRNLPDGSPLFERAVQLVMGLLVMAAVVLVCLWLFWLQGVVYAVSEEQLGMPRKWFRIAYIVLWLFIGYAVVTSIIEPLMSVQDWGQDYLYLIYSSREFVHFAGIIIAYPIVCHYAARAALVKKNNSPATFVSAIPFTLLLIFGTVLSIPFLHKYFSKKVTTNSEIIVIYAVAFGLCVFLFILGLVAAVSGLV